MTENDMKYLLGRIGDALILAGNSLKGDGSQATIPVETPVVESPALGEVGVIANRASLRSKPSKDIDPDLGRLLEGERMPLDAISEDEKWYRVDIRQFAGLHTIPDDADYAWGEASNFEIIGLG